MVGIFLVQRRLSLIGDGMGHVALAGVAIGLVTGVAPVWTALVAAVAAAVVIELLRTRGRTNGDVALAVIFYGGIAAGVVIISKSPDGTPANLMKYLFGSILTTTSSDLYLFAGLAVLIAATTWALRPRLFAVANDEEYARAVGIPVLPLNIVLAVLTATTVVVAMRVVGLLLISALMIVPNAASQLIARSFSGALRWAIAFGLVSSVGGVALSYPLNTPVGRHHRAAGRGPLHRHRRRRDAAHPASLGGDTTSPRSIRTSTAWSAGTRRSRTVTTSTTSTTATCMPPTRATTTSTGTGPRPAPRTRRDRASATRATTGTTR